MLACMSICLFQRRRGRLRQCCGRLKCRHIGKITRTNMRTSCKRLALARTVVMHSPAPAHTPHSDRDTQKQRQANTHTSRCPYCNALFRRCPFIQFLLFFFSLCQAGWLALSSARALSLSLSLSLPSQSLSLLSLSLSLFLRTHTRTRTHNIPTPIALQART